MTQGITICFACARYRPMTARVPRAHCAAFPTGIPDDILFEGYDHRKAHTGDRGVQFLLRPGKQKQLDLFERETGA